MYNSFLPYIAIFWNTMFELNGIGPNALPRAPTPLGTERVLRCCVCCVVDFCLYAAVLKMERCADLVSVFFGTYGGTLCRSGPCILRYL